MFVLVALVYPCVLALLCVGAGLLVDRASGGFLPGMLLPAIGAAALIAVSQLTTYLAPLARGTPVVMVAVAVAGFVLGSSRLRALARGWRARLWRLAVLAIAYAVALAPVLLAGRPTFSSYMALGDSAFHMMGADFLIRHGQSYGNLDLANSYGLFIDGHYNTGYPSGADTLFGGSAFVLGLPLIWAFQPFNAFMLASTAGPAWVLARRIGLDRGWAALAALSVTAPALVYGYELIGSIKEIVALPLVMSMGALVVLHRRWLGGSPRGAIPFAIVIAGGTSALGVAFGAWALVAIAVLVAMALVGLARGSMGLRSSLGLIGVGAIVVLAGAYPTFVNLSGSVRVAQAIASTSNPGNLHAPLRPEQVLGVWLKGGYKGLPTGGAMTLTYVLMAVSLVAIVLGVAHVVRVRERALAGWFALMLVVWAALSIYGTTWTGAKTLMLTSPAVVLMAWAGVAALRSSRLRLIAPLLALALAGGVVSSDAMQYHGSNLAPTARYAELASLNTRFAGRGPTLFTDFDEYSLYELRDLDVGGPDFASPPPALAAAAGGYGQPVRLGRVAPAALSAYPLIVTRRDPSAPRPPSAYRRQWQGAYYQVWDRIPGAPSRGAVLAGARDPQLVTVPLARTVRPPGWALSRKGIVMSRAGTLSATFTLHHGGAWELWLKGDVMRALTVRIDGLTLGTLGGQLDGNSLVVNALTPLRTRLGAGRHTLTITRPGADLAPGDGGAATLAAIFLHPAVSL